jgi:hypothetical protein
MSRRPAIADVAVAPVLGFLAFDYPLGRPVDLMLNGKLKYIGEVVRIGSKRAVQVAQACSSR